MDGRAYLEGLISDHFGSDAGEPIESRAGWFNLLELRGVAQGLVVAGTLDADDAATILADLTATLDELGWLPHVRFSSKVSALTSLGTGTDAGVSRPKWQELAERPPPPVLIAVESLAGRGFTVGEIDYGLVALERWSSLFRVTYAWSRPHSDNAGDRPLYVPRHLQWSAVDDRGRAYRARGGGSNGGPVITFGGQSFEPGLDPDANRVTILIRDDEDDATVTVNVTLD